MYFVTYMPFSSRKHVGAIIIYYIFIINIVIFYIFILEKDWYYAFLVIGGKKYTHTFKIMGKPTIERKILRGTVNNQLMQ